MPVLKYLNERGKSLEEVGEAVNEMKSVRLQGWMDFRWNVPMDWRLYLWRLYLWTGVVLV